MKSTTTLLRHSIPYTVNSTDIYAKLRHLPWAMLLDSGQPHGQYGRYDIIVAAPFITLTTFENSAKENARSFYTEVTQNDEVVTRDDDPFHILNQILAPYQTPQNAKLNNLPFTGGALGYFSYDLARLLEKLPNIAKPNANIPHLMVGVYDWAVVIDHREKTACLVSYGLQQTTHEQWADLCALLEPELATQNNPEKCAYKFALSSPITSNMSYAEYTQAFNQVKHYITEGDCYQVNLAQRFSAKANGDSFAAYLKLKEISPAPFMAYMDFGDIQVLSGSPERFLQVNELHVETRPIKGTRPRASDPILDALNAQDLQNSSKDRAENLMIVDLLRNDIGKNCEIGSVKADTLFQLQSFANVHHLVSIVTGKLQAAKTAIDLLRGCFPGGSITGAPKLRAMQIIEALEPHRRGVYCGAIGYIGFDGNIDTNIAIRTAVYIGQKGAIQGEISFFAGGGIVADSVLEKEYAETLDKASSMMKTMQFFQPSCQEYHDK